MKILKESTTSISMRRVNATDFELQATKISTDFEGSVAMTCRDKDFEILDARWTIFRAKDKERRGEGKAPMLVGESAYVNDKRNSVKILPDYSQMVDYTYPPGGWGGEIAHKSSVLTEAPETVSPEWENVRELFLEAMRGALQGENFLIEEREIEGGLIGYEQHWLDTKPGCRPYNIRMPEVHEWPIYTGITEQYRMIDMYNKYLRGLIIDNEDGTATGFGTYHDSFHEMTGMITYNLSDGIIVDADVNMTRVPFEHCSEIDQSFIKPMIGMNIKELAKKDVGGVLGGRLGCYHLVDAVFDMIKLAKL